MKSCIILVSLYCCLTICLFDCAPAAQPNPPTGLKAGAATANITPQLGELVVGGFSPLPADDVHDELHVRSLVLDDGRTKLAFVLCDNVGIPREVFDAAKRHISDATGIPAENQLMAATHTHSATSARSDNAVVNASELTEYQRFLVRRIADCVKIAAKRLQPARIAWGAFDEPSQLFNRRWFVVDEVDRRNPFGGVDSVRMNPGGAKLIRPAGPVDPQVSFVSVQSTAGQPIAVLANYSLHYVGGVPARTISADYFAEFSKHLAELLKAEQLQPPFVGILSNGTSGDVNNINFRDRGPKYAPYQKMREVGQLLARRVYESMQSVTYQERVELAAHAEELTLAVRKPDRELLEHCEKVLAKSKDEQPFHVNERSYAQKAKQLATSPDEITVVLQVFRIGSLGIAAIPFEVFTEIGLEIKERSALKPCFTIELANGSYGYLPTPAQHELGGYETWLGTNKVEKKASDKIVAKILDYFSQIKEK